MLTNQLCAVAPERPGKCLRSTALCGFESHLPHMANQEVVVRGGGGLSLLSVLGVVFIVLKLVGVIDWSWWLVLLPLYGPIALLLVIALVFFIIAGLVAGIGALLNK
jgi:hypothetical protein